MRNEIEKSSRRSLLVHPPGLPLALPPTLGDRATLHLTLLTRARTCLYAHRSHIRRLPNAGHGWYWLRLEVP